MQKKKHILIILQIRSLLSFVTFANDPKRLVVVSRQAIGDTSDSDGQIVVYIARRCAPFSIIFFCLRTHFAVLTRMSSKYIYSRDRGGVGARAGSGLQFFN